MEDKKSSFDKKMGEIIGAIKQAGLDPHAQLSGFLRTGNEAYITRLNDTRQKIACMDMGKIQKYLETQRKEGGIQTH